MSKKRGFEVGVALLLLCSGWIAGLPGGWEVAVPCGVLGLALIIYSYLGGSEHPPHIVPQFSLRDAQNQILVDAAKASLELSRREARVIAAMRGIQNVRGGGAPIGQRATDSAVPHIYASALREDEEIVKEAMRRLGITR
jgi:hypothetical protein